VTATRVEVRRRGRLWWRYNKAPSWLNRFTYCRRGAMGREVLEPRPILTNLHVTRIMNTVRHG
jgi:hypothetical protein